MRDKVADIEIMDPLAVILNHHSIPVMDYEISRFLSNIPFGGLIIDLGGCWGWHWRNLQEIRPDVKVVIVDLVRSNLLHAKKLLGSEIGRSIFLVHDDAVALNFPDKLFDGVWTVQTFQHIPDFQKAVEEAHRVLKAGGYFSNYSLNDQLPIRYLYSLCRKSYVVEGCVNKMFWLSRASSKQKNYIEKIFSNKVQKRWSEILYSPELHFPLPGREEGVLGKIDCKLSNNAGFLGWFARQLSYHCKKN
jgi:ubiquinone/menaquinone biosynthesis C-methylase UbiE